MKPYSFLQEIYLGEYQHKKHTYEVHIRQWENGNKYHCHIIDEPTQGEKFHTCVLLLDNRYYWHEGKTDVLDTNMRKEFNDFMHSVYTGKRILKRKRTKNITNWQALCHLWNEINNQKIDESKIYTMNIPDYTIIKPNQFRIPKKKK